MLKQKKKKRVKMRTPAKALVLRDGAKGRGFLWASHLHSCQSFHVCVDWLIAEKRLLWCSKFETLLLETLVTF